MMNNETTKKLAGVVEMLIEDSSRINDKKSQKYWYPLSMATYDVEEILEALDSMCSFRTTMWEKTEKFEYMFSGYQGCLESIMVNSGSSADLLLSFLLREYCPGKNEVLISSVTWPTQIWSLMVAGFNPILIDVDPETLNIDYDDLKSKITERTAGIAVVHLMGNPCNMDILQKICNDNNLLMIEDCCEGMGASFDKIKIGNFGLGGAFSMFFSHHICSMEGGLIGCNSIKDSDKLRVLRAHGWNRNIRKDLKELCIDDRYTFVDIGFNVRPTELQAGFGIHQLLKLPVFNKKRDIIVNKFFSFIDSSDWLIRPKIHEKAQPSWLGLPFLMSEEFSDKRNWLMLELEKNGIETRPIVAGNIARQPVAKKFPEIFNHKLKGADIVHNNGIYVGLSPMQDDSAIEQVIEIFKKIRSNL